MSRRVVLRGTGVLVPGVILATAAATAVAGPAAAASTPRPAAGGHAPEAVRGMFSAPGYAWPALAPGGPAGAAVTGVVFALTAGGRPAADRRVRFSISSFQAVGRGVWFETSPTPKAVSRIGYLDLDTDASGTVDLDEWLRHGDVPTGAVGARPMLRAQLVGSETILATAYLSVA